MESTFTKYLFPGMDEGENDFTISYNIDQYLIVDRRNNLAQAILFILNPGLTDHDYDTTSHCRGLFNEKSSGLNDLPKEIHLEIEKKLVEEGISLVTSRMIQNNSLYIPYSNPLHGSDPHLMPKGDEGDFRWSLYTLE
jgi:hypothetical protein